MSQTRPLRVAIIGAGPSGFYAAESLAKELENVSIDLFDRLPTPYGLVRFGVAPDHQKIKSVTKMYEKTAQRENVRFLGNVAFGQDISYEDVKKHYDAVIYTVGASSDRNLAIPGEELLGNMSATEFVAWYNGHPDYEAHISMVEAEAVAVIGMGNVAVDVTRVLAKSADELKSSDIADHALEVLKNSKVKDVYMIGRRGPAQAKFTTKEVRELGELLNADIVVNEAEMVIDEASLASIENDPTTKKNIEVLTEFAKKPLEGKERRVHIKFLASPVEILGEGKVEAIRLEKNRLEPSGDYINAVGTGEYEVLAVQMVLRSVGYRGVALPGVTFDERRAVIPNDKGVVLDAPKGKPIGGEYVAGWIKRGPSGVIGTNKADAAETVEQLVALQGSAKLSDDANKHPAVVLELLGNRNVPYITFEQWLKLDKLETEAGLALGRPRVKLTNVQKMLEACAD